MSEYKSTPHCKYLCQYHIIFCPKFRYSVLKGDVEKSLKNIQNLNLSMVDVGSLWSVGKFISTIGNVSAETIKKYIEEQKGK